VTNIAKELATFVIGIAAKTNYRSTSSSPTTGASCSPATTTHERHCGPLATGHPSRRHRPPRPAIVIGGDRAHELVDAAGLRPQCRRTQSSFTTRFGPTWSSAAGSASRPRHRLGPRRSRPKAQRRTPRTPARLVGQRWQRTPRRGGRSPNRRAASPGAFAPSHEPLACGS
jgi:hypothetical protein